MHCMVSKGVRGGISQISNRACFANNIDVPSYDSFKNPISIFYTDCNSLYPWALQAVLPHRDFRWLSKYEIEKLDVLNFPSSGEKGLILEVDLEYPDHLHDLHSDYPLAVEKLLIKKDMLSPYVVDFLNRYGMKYTEQKRLVSNLYDKHDYVVHIKNLQMYIKHGLRLVSVKRAIEFTQTAWMKPFIDLNAQKRAKATSKFESEYFKLQMNSCFGNLILVYL